MAIHSKLTVLEKKKKLSPILAHISHFLLFESFQFIVIIIYLD